MASARAGKSNGAFYYGWIIVAVVALCSFVQSQETFPVLSILLKPMTEEFGWSRTSFALPMALGTVLGGLMGPIIGPIVDRSGPRWVAVSTLSLLGVLLFSMGWVSTLWHFYLIQITARTVTHGIVGLTLSVVVPKWFIAKRGRAVALQSLGGRGGQFLLPPLTLIIVKQAGWRLATISQGILVWVVAVLPAAIFLRRQPEDMGLLPDGVTQSDSSSMETQNGNKRDPENSLTSRQALTTPAFYLLTLANLLNVFAAAGLNLHLFPYLTDSGISENMAVTIITVWFFCGVVGSVFAGFIADRLNSRLVTMLCFAVMAISVLLLPAAQSISLAFIFVIVQGLSQGGMLTMRLLWPDYFGRKNLGAIRGLTHPPQNLAIALGPLIGGVMFDLTGGYTWAFLAFAVGLFGATACVWMAKPPIVVAPMEPNQIDKGHD